MTRRLVEVVEHACGGMTVVWEVPMLEIHQPRIAGEVFSEVVVVGERMKRVEEHIRDPERAARMVKHYRTALGLVSDETG